MPSISNRDIAFPLHWLDYDFRFRPMNKFFLAAATSLALLLSSSVWADNNPPRFPVISLTAGMHVIKAEVASTEAQREQGLMFRESLGTNEGMVFLFHAPAGVCMWMKNTPLPLSVAFMDRDGRIINIENMKPQSLDSHCAKQAAYYALEMQEGWFKQRNIKPGSVIGGLPPVR